jgi:hypothetical protein
MNFLQLVQRAKLESGRLTAGPATVSAAAGRDALLVDWVNEAWRAIQMMPARNWRWMRRTALATLSAGQGSYTPAGLGMPDLGYWAKPSDAYAPTVLDSANPSSEAPLTFWEYERFRAAYIVGPQTNAWPQHWSIAPADGSLLLGPAPATAMTLRIDYFKAPQELTQDADVPDMPPKFHPLIVWAAMSQLAGFDAAPETLARAYDNYQRDLSALIAEQGDNIAFGANTL